MNTQEVILASNESVADAQPEDQSGVPEVPIGDGTPRQNRSRDVLGAGRASRHHEAVNVELPEHSQERVRAFSEWRIGGTRVAVARRTYGST